MDTRTEILTEIRALSAHYPRRQLAVADLARWFDDYANDLQHAGYDATDVRIACTNWRTSEAKRMPSPGEMMAYCKRVFRPDRLPALALEPPPRREIPPEEREYVRQGFRDLIAKMKSSSRMDFKTLARRPGETEVEQAEHLWPSHRVDRMRAAGKL